MKIAKYSSFLIILLCVAFFLSVFVSADTARDITSKVSILCKGIDKAKLFDNNISTSSKGSNIEIEISSGEKIGGLYIKYNNFASTGTLNGEIPVGTHGFVHEFIPLDNTSSAALSFASADICDIQVFSKGDLPKEVQLWQKGNAKTDILLCSTHSDDDQLFFAGLLPYYATIKKANVRVAYFVNHYDTYNRTHELLDGLWECGVTNYPDIGPFPDGYSESITDALKFLENSGFTYDEILNFQKSLLEKYKPLVVVLHDFNGEYSHGMHMLNTKSFVEACEEPNTYAPEKIYVHLYKENQIRLNIDEQREEFGGLSAFQISQKAFLHHKSQHWTWFYNWIYGKDGKTTTSDRIRLYNPAYYGLYYTRVGNDTLKNCLLENITLYTDRKIIIPKTDVEPFTKPITNLKDAVLSENNTKKHSAITAGIVATLTLIIIFTVYKTNKRKKS